MNNFLLAFFLTSVSLLIGPQFRAYGESPNAVRVQAIIASPISLNAVIGELSTLKYASDSATSARVVLKSFDRLIQKDQIEAFEVFQAISNSSKLATNLAYAASSGAKMMNDLNYYAVELSIPMSVFKAADGTASFFKMLDGIATIGEEFSKETKDTQKIFASALNAALGGAHVASIVTGIAIPGGSIVLTAAPMAVGLFLKYTPKAYKYYFASVFNIESLDAIPKEQFLNAKTFTYIQCEHEGKTYWGKMLDESASAGLLSGMTTRGNTSKWEHKVSDFKLFGAWLHASEKQLTGFATQNSLRAILNSCKLPLLITDKKIVSGRVTELRELYRTMPDDGISFSAKDFGYIGRSYPVILLRQFSKEKLSQ